ncbi:MAG: 50S ribosomal protein L23 [Candidatus Levybacteria bacterium CG10_big_fil_rev_8_21_14_0_10_36_7]|nr:MAG: 50S ribosomal protein L23 [Candidatus Levybacteria bacterium CG10_big_fil_rev_8_21_14_0_10_36_7]
MRSGDFIIKPLISEHSLKEINENGRFTFVVKRSATKDDIKMEVEKLFKVNVLRVYTSYVKGTKTRSTKTGRKTIDTTYKKARVKLAKDQKIDIFEVKS